MTAVDIPLITARPSFLTHHADAAQFQNKLAAQQRGEMECLVGYYQDVVAGYVYIKWRSEYPPFAAEGIPEIKDLRVLPEFRRRGIATALVSEAERRIFSRSSVAGIAVGLYSDYGPAQRMYVRRGYIPDGRGLMHTNNRPVPPGHDVFVDDDLILYLTKARP
jgi:ribosomal protein S18 acetylase RimI-like enzyme